MKVHFAVDVTLATVGDEIPQSLLESVEGIVRDAVGDLGKSLKKRFRGPVVATAVLGAMTILDSENC